MVQLSSNHISIIATNPLSWVVRYSFLTFSVYIHILASFTSTGMVQVYLKTFINVYCKHPSPSEGRCLPFHIPHLNSDGANVFPLYHIFKFGYFSAQVTPNLLCATGLNILRKVNNYSVSSGALVSRRQNVGSHFLRPDGLLFYTEGCLRLL